ncbi:MAG TPA: glycosyl hydrolase family 65 protein [Phycisphaerae bacterium]|nr:glycosyl hydrolase family 65 protein [Phycisphaerae bacterium]
MSAGDNWVITNTRHDAHTLAQHNSVFTISNGYLGLKGNLQEDCDGHRPVTIINGVYDELDMFSLIRASKHERPWLDPDHFDTAGKSPAVANLPDPLFMRVFVDDRAVSLGRGHVSAFRQEFDLRCGLYHYTYDYNDGGHITRIEMWRFASLKHAHRVYMRCRVTPFEDGVPLRILSGINARVHSNTTHERQFSIMSLETGAGPMCRLHVRTNARRHDVYMTVVNGCRAGAGPRSIRGSAEHDAVYTAFESTSKAGQPLTIDRMIHISSSEDRRHGDRLPDDDTPEQDQLDGFDRALEEQRAIWETIWDRADVQVDGDANAQLYLRFALYQLLAAAPRFTDRLSVPVKLLTGEHYQGNTFWDTDLYIEPFYLSAFPELARTCLTFRHMGLEPGRRIARELGYEGAKLAWQAGPYGEECLGKWYRFARTNIHINAAAVYSLMQYYWATGDDDFMHTRGIDILVASARFYASRAVYNSARDTYEIHDVAGPDEAHCRSKNNFYTNYLAVRTLRWAADVLAGLQDADADGYADAARRLGLADDEPEHWRHVAQRLTLLFDPHTKIYEQCEGFHQLPAAPADLLEGRQEWFVPLAPYRALNQPDVVMAMVLFRDEFPEDVRRANWAYYKDKSMNFSSMSFAVNAIMSADVGEMDEAYRSFMISAGMDLDQSLTGRGDTHAGLHGSALGGAWMAAVFGFGGVHLCEGGLRIDPKLPAQWERLRFNLVLRGEVVKVSIDRNEIKLAAGNERGLELTARVAGQAVTLRSGQTQRVRYRS